MLNDANFEAALTSRFDNTMNAVLGHDVYQEWQKNPNIQVREDLSAHSIMHSLKMNMVGRYVYCPEECPPPQTPLHPEFVGTYGVTQNKSEGLMGNIEFVRTLLISSLAHIHSIEFVVAPDEKDMGDKGLSAAFYGDKVPLFALVKTGEVVKFTVSATEYLDLKRVLWSGELGYRRMFALDCLYEGMERLHAAEGLSLSTGSAFSITSGAKDSGPKV